MKRLLILLTDSLATFQAKGELKPRYYNPGDVFDEVHFFTPGLHEPRPADIAPLVGRARPVIHAWGPHYALRGLLGHRGMWAAVRAAAPDVLRAYDPGIRGGLAVVWAKRLGVPSVISVHADLDEQRRIEHRPAHYLRRLFERSAVPQADVVLCVSRYLTGYASRYGARRTEVVYNRVDLEQFHPRADARRADAPLSVLSVCRLDPQKSPEVLIRAAAGAKIHLTLIGDGPSREALRRLIAALGIQDRVRLVRSVPHEEIGGWYRAADVFAIATRYEGFCIPVLEAMASGLPVVASDLEPIRELAGEAGMLVENTPSAFAAALTRLVNDAELRRSLGARAAARARMLDGRVMEQQERAMYLSLSRMPDANDLCYNTASVP